MKRDGAAVRVAALVVLGIAQALPGAATQTEAADR